MNVWFLFGLEGIAKIAKINKFLTDWVYDPIFFNNQIDLLAKQRLYYTLQDFVWLSITLLPRSFAFRWKNSQFWRGTRPLSLLTSNLNKSEL